MVAQYRPFRPTHEQLRQWLQSHTIGGGAPGGYIGNGSKVGFSLTSPHVWNKLEQLLDVTVPTVQAAKIDVTTHGTGGFMRNIPGLKTVGDTMVKLLRDQSRTTAPNQNALFDYLSTQTDLWWRVEIPDGPNLAIANFEAYEFQGRVLDFKPLAPIGGRQEVDSSIVFDGTSFVRYDPTASLLG